MHLAIDYRLTGLGWAECSISDEESNCTISASYLSDALRNMLLAASAAISGFTRLTFNFDEEPGEYRWVITSPRMNEIELQILEFNELWGEKPDSEGKLLFKTRCRPQTFAQAVYEAASRVLEKHGKAGYAAEWSEHPFPSFQFEGLGRLLESEN